MRFRTLNNNFSHDDEDWFLQQQIEQHNREEQKKHLMNNTLMNGVQDPHTNIFSLQKSKKQYEKWLIEDQHIHDTRQKLDLTWKNEYANIGYRIHEGSIGAKWNFKYQKLENLQKKNDLRMNRFFKW